ncbi:hypothetical protein HKD37_09G026308 [Glycine soja]
MWWLVVHRCTPRISPTIGIRARFGVGDRLKTSMQVPQVVRMASGTAYPAGEAGWPEWLAGRASTAGGHSYTRG